MAVDKKLDFTSDGWVEKCSERHDAINAQLARILKVLHGNGTDGLITEIARMKEREANIAESLMRGTQKFDAIESRLRAINNLIILLAFVAGGNVLLKIAEMFISSKL